TWDQFLDWFPDQDACVHYLQGLRWPQGFVCPRCGDAAEPYRATRARLMCRTCRHQCTVTTGTVFEKTRTPLRSWLAAVWYATNQKHGVSALGLQRVLGVSSYQTAWAMLHRLRRAMVRPGRERLGGRVEVDETYVGGPGRGRGKDAQMRRWGSNTAKVIVAIAVEVHEPKGFGRVRLRRVSAATGASLIPFVCAAVEPDAVVHTDGSPLYRSLSEHGYLHHRSVVSSSHSPAHVSMPAVHRVASLLKRWFLGTHQGAVQPRQLDYYLDEFTFRFNRRTSRSRGLLFYRLLEQAVVTDPVTYHEIVGHRR
ncbi:MAG: IS1595 family transposase, partial [Gammaproteobacteria bacterium]